MFTHTEGTKTDNHTCHSLIFPGANHAVTEMYWPKSPAWSSESSMKLTHEKAGSLHLRPAPFNSYQIQLPVSSRNSLNEVLKKVDRGYGNGGHMVLVSVR